MDDVWKIIMTGKCDINSVIGVLLAKWKRSLVHNKIPVESVQLSSIPALNQDPTEEGRLFVYAKQCPSAAPDPSKLRRQDFDNCFQLHAHRVVVLALKDPSDTHLILDAACAQYGVYDKLQQVDCPIVLAPEDSKCCMRYLNVCRGQDMICGSPLEWARTMSKEHGPVEELYLTMLQHLEAALSKYMKA